VSKPFTLNTLRESLTKMLGQ